MIYLLPVLLLKAEQFGLFDTPTLIAPHVRKDGVVIHAHMRVIAKRPHSLAVQHSPHTTDLFAEAVAEPAPPPAAETSPEIVEHVTKRGRTLRGMIMRGITREQARAIDEYTFFKDGGWFIREKHLGAQPIAAETAAAIPVAVEAMQAKATKDRSAQAGKLRKVADGLLASADDDLNRDRSTNTRRRASMAANAINNAEGERALALTMQNLANAIEAGEAQHLSGVTSKAQVEQLQRTLHAAMYEADKGLTYGERERRKGRPPEPTDIRFAKLPTAWSWGSHMAWAADKLEKKSPTGNARLIAALRKMRGDGEQFVMSEAQQEIVQAAHKKLQAVGEGFTLKDSVEHIKNVDRFARMGIKSDSDLQLALTEYVLFRSGKRKEDPVKAAERALIGQRVGIDFFPTPMSVASRMVELAGIEPGMSVLEPSAGSGNLADAAKAAGGEVDTVEISPALQDLLKLKGHTLAGVDFDDFTPSKQYDAVIMNPPFSDRRDAAHIQRAFNMLKPGGTLVAIAGEGVFFGSDRKATEFQEWLNSLGAHVEALPANTFMDKKLLATTGVNARLIVIEKPMPAPEQIADPAPPPENLQDEPFMQKSIDLAEDRADLASALIKDPGSDLVKSLIAKIAIADADAGLNNIDENAVL